MGRELTGANLLLRKESVKGMRLVLLSAASLFLTLVATLLAYSQRDNGTITGTITNPDNGVVIGVAVQLKHVSTGTTYNTVSSPTGIFAFTQLSAGAYELSVPRTGITYAAYVKKDLIVDAGGTLRADIRLQWGPSLGTIGDDAYVIFKDR